MGGGTEVKQKNDWVGERERRQKSVEDGRKYKNRQARDYSVMA